MSAPVLPTRLEQPVGLPLGAFVERAGALTPGLHEAEREDYRDTVNGIEVGVWEGTPGQFPASRDGYSEICQILSGLAILHTDGGESVELRAGDTIVMPTGWVGRWELLEPLRKLYVIVHDRSSSSA
jgi:uncharacterized cupin superfamily protein